MLRTLCLGVAALLVLLTFGFTPVQDAPAAKDPLAVRVPAFPNSTCPIMGKAASAKLFVESPKGRIYVCCKACNRKVLNALDSSYAAAYPVKRALGNTHCPITGEELDKDALLVEVQGLEIGVCCEDCIPKLLADAQAWLVKLQDPKVVDLDNHTCPVSGEPVAANTLVLIGETLVRLSSPSAVEAVELEPAKVLEKARSIAAREAEERKRAQQEKDAQPAPKQGAQGTQGDLNLGAQCCVEHWSCCASGAACCSEGSACSSTQAH